MYALFVFMLLTVLTYYALKFILPKAFDNIRSSIAWCMNHPLYGFLALGSLCALLFTVGDFFWGAYGWTSFGKVFHLQGGRFMVQALFFFMGAVIGSVDIIEYKFFWEKLAKNWAYWVLCTVILGTAYIGYSLHYFYDVIMNYDIVRFLRGGGSLMEVWPIASDVLPNTLPRTIVHGYFVVAQALMFLAVFYRFFNRPIPILTSLAKNGYGLFLIHEGAVIWLQFALIGSNLPVLLKFITVAVVGISVGWLSSDALRRLPGFRSVIGSGVRET